MADTRIVYGARCAWWDSVHNAAPAGTSWYYGNGPVGLDTSEYVLCEVR